MRLTEAAIRSDRPAFSIRGDEVDVTIRGDEVVVRTVDLDAYEARATPSPSEGDDADEAELPSEDPIANWFDPVPVASLEEMFPAGGKWKGWAEHAQANGLVTARLGRAKFNPYLAAMWFLQRNTPGWSQEKVYRTLAGNLPERSMHYHDRLLIGLE